MPIISTDFFKVQILLLLSTPLALESLKGGRKGCYGTGAKHQAGRTLGFCVFFFREGRKS